MSCCPEHQEHKQHKPHQHHNNHAHSIHERVSFTNGSVMMSHGSPADFLRRFFIVTVLLVPLVLLMKPVLGFLGLSDFVWRKYLQFGVASIIFYFALIFFEHASHEIKMRRFGMMTLVSLAVGAGYLFSVASTFIPVFAGVEFYLEISTLIWVLLFGHYLEAKSSSAAGNALQEVAKLLPKLAHVLVSGKVEEIDIDKLQAGDIVLVKPGEKIPADGIIVKGQANIDESLISGESKPLARKVKDKVVAGSICIDGSLEVKLERVGENSTVGQIKKLVEQAQMTKPTAQKIADKAAGILTVIAVSVAFLTVAIWFLLVGKPLVFAITLAITVLVIACPHALGLAIPTVSTIATQLAVKNGVFLKNLEKLEVIKGVNYVVFDKTGTLTKGEFGVSEIIALAGASEKQILLLASSLEAHSSHVIGASIVAAAKKKGIKPKPITNFKNLAGKGIEAKVDGKDYLVGSRALINERNLLNDEAEVKYQELSNKGKTTVFVATKEKVLGLIALSDEIKAESYLTVNKLHKLGVRVAILTGDNKQVAEAVAKELSIDTYFAEVLPEDKYRYVQQLQQQGNKVMMVGDGVNDAPALTQADVGVAIGAGSDVAVEAGDVVLTRSNPEDIARLIKLSRSVYRKMVENLLWATGYNVLAIPAAAGVFAFWNIFLKPEVGAILMSLSSVIVVVNALTLRRINLEIK